MFKVKIYTIGRLKETWLQEALAEYEKRLSRQIGVEWVLAKNERELTEKIQSPWIALDVRGELVDSVALSKKLLKLFSHHGSRLNFLIGGSEGIDPLLLEKSAWRWSLSPLTFTHQMTRLILLEQLYRAIEIDSGSAYHK
ncbi:MAG: 23S rRNA (pseudouridine(1915)-N(3))-methyltransferase RlmH [Verrucomicrobiota bacterium]|nr:23S rRNA (pseudouridine(1915)-N(3))-methyltransferase RlmH [Verrucomicrobiota bacterium]